MRTSKAILTAALLASMSAAAQQAADPQPSDADRAAMRRRRLRQRHSRPGTGFAAGGSAPAKLHASRCACSHHHGPGREPLH